MERSEQRNNRPQATAKWLLLTAFALQAGVIAAGLAATGKLNARIVTDSSSYIEFPFGSLEAALNYSRTAGYPIFLGACLLFGELESTVAIAHWILYAIAVALFGYGLSAIWKSSWGCFFVCSSMLYSNIVYRYLDNITPDVLTVAIAIATMGGVLRMAARVTPANLLAVAVGVFACCQMRPAYLFLLLLVPAVVAIVRWLANSPSAPKGTWWRLLAATIAPTVAYCIFRWLIVGYVGLVSFGGNNFAGVMSSMMDEDSVQRMSGEPRAFAELVLKRRNQFALENPSFPSHVLSSYSQIEDQFDDATWSVCVPAAMDRHDNDWPAANRAMMQLSIAIVKAEPTRYAVWLLKAFRRAIWVVAGEFAGNPIHQAIFAAWLLVYSMSLFQERRDELSADALPPSHILPVLMYVSLLFCLAKIALVITTSPPLGRFMDAAAVFLITVPAFAVWRLGENVLSRARRTNSASSR